MNESTLSSLHFKDFVEIFILMLGAFLIGYGFAYYYFKNELKKAKSGYSAQTFDDKLEAIVEGEIKATKTFERGGFEVEDTKQQEIEFIIEKDKKKRKPSQKNNKNPDASS